MNALDFIVVIILLIGGLNGLRHGLIKALANFIGWALALIIGAQYTSTLAPSMLVFSHDPVVQKILAFAFIVLFIILLTWIVTALLNGILKTLMLGPLNRLAGGAFGTLKGLLLVLVAMNGLAPWLGSSPQWKHSKFVESLLPFAPIATELSKAAANEALQHMKSENQASANFQRPLLGKDLSETQEKHSGNLTNNPFY